MLYSDMVTLKVGHQKKEFRVHRDLLMSKSEYFAKAFNGAWEESSSKVAELEDSDPVVVSIVVAWLYTGQVHYVAEAQETTTTSHRLDNRSLEPPRDPKDTEVRSWELLTAIYIFADRYMLKALKKDMLVLFSIQLPKHCSLLPFDDVNLLVQVWSNLPHDSGLKQLILDVWAFKLEEGPDSDVVARLPTELCAGLFKRLFHRLPYTLCRICVGDALERWEWKHWDCQYDAGIFDDNDELAPFEHDMCWYHEHHDEDERDACQAEAEAAKKA